MPRWETRLGGADVYTPIRLRGVRTRGRGRAGGVAVARACWCGGMVTARRGPAGLAEMVVDCGPAEDVLKGLVPARAGAWRRRLTPLSSSGGPHGGGTKMREVMRLEVI